MKKIILIIIILFFVGFGWYFYSSNKQKNNNVQNNQISSSEYQTQKSDTSITSNNTSQTNNSSDFKNTTALDNNTTTESQNNVIQENSPNNAIQNNTTEVSHEEEIASFSTKIFNKDSDRQNNISITCNTLNGSEVANNETFSFCSVVGKATSDKGYKKADVLEHGKKVQALGGGNCQVSSTLYNAVLAVPELEVTERHEHSGYVPYVGEGKDAAVAYGSYDFKFVNHTGATIKITAETTGDNVIIKLLKK